MLEGGKVKQQKKLDFFFCVGRSSANNICQESHQPLMIYFFHFWSAQMKNFALFLNKMNYITHLFFSSGGANDRVRCFA